MQLGLLLCANVSFVVYERQGSDEKDKGLLMSRLVAFRLDEYVGLDLTLIRCRETSVVYMFGVMRRIRDKINVSK